MAGGAEAGIRLTLLDVCYLSGGLTGQGHHRSTRSSSGSPTERGRLGGRVGAFAAGTRLGRRPDRGGRPLRPRRAERGPRPRSPRSPARTAARPPLRAAGRERCRAGVLRLHPDRAAAPTGLLGPPTTAVHATHLTADDIALLGGDRDRCVLLPDHRTGPGRRDRTRPRRCPTPAVRLPGQRPARGDRPVRGAARSGAARTAGHRRRGRFTPAELVTAAGSPATRRSAGPAAGGSRSARPADLVIVDPSAVRTAGCRPGAARYGATAADVAVVVVGGAGGHDGVHRLGAVDADARRSLTDVEA